MVLLLNSQFEKESNTIIINVPTEISNKVIKILNNFYPSVEISIWDNFLLLSGNINPILVDCGIDEDNYNFDLFDADCCKLTLLKTLFLTNGKFYYTQDNNINSKGYSLEFYVRPEIESLIKNLLNFSGFELKSTKRMNTLIFYTRNSNTVCDLLVKMGASYTALDVQNALAMREMRNSANRQNNCFESNLDKTISAGTAQVEAINYLIKNGYFDALDETLKEIALARLANLDISLKDLQTILGYDISRAGIKYRLDKIIEIYKNYKGGK
ncbi:MAG: DNA-binding protein WhiA [Clostridia bacterium]|nr:DNA-binding protein WhiA [Clostridia bacterium]